MAYRTVILDEARNEYRNIVTYMVEVLKSPQAAANFMDTFERQLALIETTPELFPLSRMPELSAEGYRAVPVNNYLALYRVAGDLIVIAHLFHQSQDYARLI